MPVTHEAVREKQINIRLSEDEAERLKLVAEHHGLNIANVFRWLLKREADAIVRETEQARTKKPKK